MLLLSPLLILTWLRLQGVSHKGYVSKPPIPEECEANRLRDEAVKMRKEAAKDAATRKRERKEKHEKACKIALGEGRPRPATPESTEEEDSSDAELNFGRRRGCDRRGFPAGLSRGWRRGCASDAR